MSGISNMAAHFEVAVVAANNSANLTVPRMAAGDVLMSVYSTVPTDYTANASINASGQLVPGANASNETLIVAFARKQDGPMGDYGVDLYQHSNL